MELKVKNKPETDKPETATEEKSPSVYISVKTRNIILFASVSIIMICVLILAVDFIVSDVPVEEVPRLKSIQTVVNLSPPRELPLIEQTDYENADILPEWRELYERNNHFVGWLKFDGTIIDYPVMQYLEEEWETADYTGNTYYLKRDFDRKHSEPGSLFVDWHTPIVNKKRPDNTIIYGHNMSSGTMFHHLINYFTEPNGKDLSAAYYDNPTIDFTTVYDNERNTYKIFAAMYINVEEVHGEVFNYYQRRFFDSRASFYDYIGNVMDRSVFYTDIDIEYGDELLTLSTCFFPLSRAVETRVVVVARRVREGEDETVDTSVAYINPSPKYFDYYYRVRGGAWEGRNWDTSKVKGFDEFYSQ